MPTYSGSFPLVAQGAAVTVTLDGVVQSDPAPGVVGSAVVHGSLPYSYVYEAGDDDTSLLATVTTSAGVISTELILDVAASIASGGGVVLDGATYLFERNAGLDLGANSGFTAVPFDSLDGESYDGSTPIPDGLYMGRLEVDFAQPAEDRSVVVKIDGGGGDGTSIRQGPFLLSSEASNSTAYTLWTSGPLMIVGGAPAMNIATSVVGESVTPADLAITYIEFDLTRIG